jgi:hypothetical protein
MTNPFAAAIECLRNDGDGDMWFHEDEKQAAIRLLEAAGKVDKVKCQRAMDVLFYAHDHIADQVIALLSSLPDRPKEKA